MSHFGVVDNAVNTVKKVESYIQTGMETTVDVALDLAENEKDSKGPKLDELRSAMVEFVKMQRDYDQFLEAVNFTKKKANELKDEDVNFEEILDQKLKELKKQTNDKELLNHEKYVDMNNKIEDVVNPTEDIPMPSLSCATQFEDEDIEVTQQDINTKCPYTGMEMKDPVRNKNCGHNYDRAGAKQLIKDRGNKARCPVAGCKNDRPIVMDDLDDNKELKRYMDKKNRQLKKGRK